jgi:hypothetical protein
VVQAGLLAVLIKRFGEVRLSLLGLASGGLTYMLYGLATQGWMMYVFILCNLLAFAAGPACRASSPRPPPPGEQGELMGSLQSIGSIGVIFMPLLGTAILAGQPPAAAGLAHRQHLLRVRGDAGGGDPGGAPLLPRPNISNALKPEDQAVLREALEKIGKSNQVMEGYLRYFRADVLNDSVRPR